MTKRKVAKYGDQLIIGYDIPESTRFGRGFLAFEIVGTGGIIGLDMSLWTVEDEVQPSEWRVIPAFPIYEMTTKGAVRVVDTHEEPEKIMVNGPHGFPCYVLLLWDGTSYVKTVSALLWMTFPEGWKR